MATGISNSGNSNIETCKIQITETNYNVAQERTTQPLHTFPPKVGQFYGREDKIQEIKEAIDNMAGETDSLLRTVVLVGFGGMGKSETVKAFAETFNKSYPYIVWINAQTKQSLIASFKGLVGHMNALAGTKIKFQSLEDIPEIQLKLANVYDPSTGIYIFDNAERLQTTDEKLGIETFLYKDFLQNKPIFIATSRNGSAAWNSNHSNVKLIRIERLMDDQSSQILRNHLRIQRQDIPCRERDVSLLAKTLGGFSLALKLVGSAIYQKAQDNALDVIDFQNKIDLRIKAYIDILKDVSLEDNPELSEYERAIKVIYDQTMEEVKACARGSVAIKLFDIMACLHPDGLYLGLIDAIYSETICKSPDENTIANSDVKNGIKLLVDFSLASLYEHKMLNVHRLIQQCARNNLKMPEPIEKLTVFFERNNHKSFWNDHLLFLLALSREISN